MIYRIKNWAKFQHFKDRRPPWVKLYRDLLDDREWHKLDGDSAKMLVSLWLIGSENSGELPEIEELAFRLRIDEKLVQKCLDRLGHWLITERYQDDIGLSQKNSVAEQINTATDIEMPLRDREETETEIKEANASLSSDPDDLGTKVLELKKTELPCPHQKLIELYAKHLPNLAKPRSWDGQRQTAMRQRWHMCSKKSAFSDGYSDEAGGLAFWDSFFEYLARDTQLPNGYESNGRHWVPDLPWILNSTNFQKILDGKYDLQKNRASR